MSMWALPLNATHPLRIRQGVGGVLAFMVCLLASSQSLALDGEASSASAPAAQATIPFANRGGIFNWQVVDDTHLLIEDTQHRWYQATLQGPAIRLAFAEQLGFDTGPSSRLEQFSSIVVEGVRYPIVSLVRTDPPTRGK